MKRFLIHIVIFILLVLGSMMVLFYQANGSSDAFYTKISTPRQSSLILGTSKASQGILPQHFDSIVPNHDLFNFAFTVAHSPYGPAYLRSVKLKLKEENTTSGIFIITVDPWSLVAENEQPDNEAMFPENESFLNHIPSVNAHPNIPYLLAYYRKSYFKILRKDPTKFVHPNGWLEVTVAIDSATINTRIESKKKEFDKRKQQHSFSEKRLFYLYKTIDYLKEKGDVYLVRLPVHHSMMEIENDLLPEFDSIMEDLKQQKGIPYFNLSVFNDYYLYTDGLHLQKDSGKEVSLKIAKWIREQQADEVSNY